MYSLKVSLPRPAPVAQSKQWCNGVVNSEISAFSVTFVPESAKEASNFEKHVSQNEEEVSQNGFRPRLSSESSVNSEDSYCIVFEADSDVQNLETESDSDYECKSDRWNNEEKEDDEEEEEESSSDDNDDDDDDEEEEGYFPSKKVTFNLNPVVHPMVQWNFAYRAARKGPWEEMARDRERFKGRINSIGQVLNPVLTRQHRSHVWKERFNTEK